ncbi:MAG: amino acid adenylation domain-containing protein, partial [Rhodanobacteraceae bacterium]
RSIAAAPGILANAVENVLVLDYGSDEALRIIGDRAHELAAVMIEPVQSRNPTLQPREFVQRLRPLCDAGGCALIFDEVITGFRVAQGGAQEFYNVRADIATYGKIIGGGLPFAAIAGSAKWMDALDGGDWRFGDDSYPETGVTYFAGTFVRHPLALAAAKASLIHLKQRGPALQRELNQRTAALVERLNTFFGARAAPLTAISASSLWRVSVDTDQPCASLFYYALRERGLHVYEQFNGFLSEAHGDSEADAIATRIEGVVDQLLGAGVLTRRVAKADADGAAVAPQTGGAERPLSDVQTAVAAYSHAAPPDEIPLTDAQLEKWVTCQFGGGSNLVFNESLLLTLDGTLDRSALERALAFVTQRHEALTLSFAEDGGSQRVGTPQALTADFIDFSGTDAETRLAAHCVAAVRQPFDLTHAPLLRAQLLRLAPERHALLVVAHHLVFDGWSEAVFLDELAQAYNAFVAGQQPELTPAESYRAYVLTERARRADGDASLQMDYWQRVYSTIPEPLLLPADRRPQGEPEPDLSAATVRHEFSPDLVAALRQCARRKGVTLYGLLLAGFGVLLARLSGQHDFVIGIPFAGQALAGSDHLIGDGVNTLPLRLSVPAQMSFGELARATHRTLLDAAEHQDITLQTLLHGLGLARGSERRRLAEVIFNLNPRVPQLAFTGLDYSLRDCAKAALSRELFFNLNDSGKRLTLDLHYLTALFDESTIRRWIAHYETLLDAAVSDDDITVAALPLLTGAQRDMVLHVWNATAREYDRGASLPALIKAQAARTPDRIAVECEGSSLSYAELERHADAVARALNSRGVGRGELVGVCLPRSVEMLIAALGIMKSGGAYVPLDPAFPVERLRYMAEHSGLRQVVVLSAERTPPAIAQAHQLLELATLDPAGIPESPLPAVGGDDLAYVLYTSGSTGQPKGVRILHRNLVNFLLSMRDRPGIGADDVLCAVTTLSFDIAGLELYLPLTVGARIVLATEHYHADADALFRLLRERGVTLLQTTPSLLRLLLDGDRVEGVRGLKLLIGGEALPRDLVERALPHCRELWNLYGPTETTIWSTAQQVQQEDGPVSLGTPIANTRVYVLDPHRQPVPPGAIGEIWIGGDGVADGYQARPDLTAERFVEDPFVSDGSRMYHTGDLGSLHDGVLHFHGRADQQIKLRGYRIEPGDIESVAMQGTGVREAVVVTRDFGPEDKRLVLYVAADHEPALIARLRDALRERLPPYMLPQHIEVLQTLPRTANGKIDRRALPLPVQVVREVAAQAPQSRASEPPLGDLERAFIDIWRDLLRVREVGLHDNFFDLGGDSLLAVRVFQRAQEITGVNLPLATLLTAPTVAGQAAAFRAAGAAEPRTAPQQVVVTDKSTRDPWAPLVPFQPLGTRSPLFCVHAVGGNVLNYVPLAKALGPEQPFYGLQAIGLDGITPPLDSLPVMASRYIAEIRKVQPHGPYLLAGGSMGGMIAYEMACQLRAGNEEVALLALFDTFGPGNRLFEIERAGSVEQMGYRWNDRLYRLRHASPGKRLEMLWIALRWRIEQRVDRYRIGALRRRGKALQHALRYREIQRCNERAYFAYEPPPYEGSITLFRASEHPGEMKATRTLGWEVVVAGNIEVIDLPGAHNTLMEQPALVTGLQAVLKRLNSASDQPAQSLRVARGRSTQS